MHLYSDTLNNKVLLIKIARNGDALARNIIEREKCTHIDLMDLMKFGHNIIPKFLDEGIFRDNPYIVSEYIDWPVEIYLKKS